MKHTIAGDSIIKKFQFSFKSDYLGRFCEGHKTEWAFSTECQVWNQDISENPAVTEGIPSWINEDAALLNASHCLHSTFGNRSLVAPATIWNALLHINFVKPSTVLILTESDFRAESILVTQNLYLQQKKKEENFLIKTGCNVFPPLIKHCRILEP